MKNNFVEIKNDVYFIADRLREIDDEYRLVYNLDKAQYEVHTSKGEYCFAVRYNDLDERTLTYARSSRAERQAELIAEIDRENEKIRNSQIMTAVEKIAEVYT